MAGRLPLRQRQCAAVRPAGRDDSGRESHRRGDLRREARSASDRPGSSQYQITTITPYGCCRILRSAKGRATSANRPSTTLLFPPVDKEGKCQPTEVGFLGYSSGNTDGATSLPTVCHSSTGPARMLGYQGSLFIGNARIDADIPTEPNQFVTHVTTYNLLNDRSLLCQATDATSAPTPKQHSSWSRGAPRWISATAPRRPNLP